MADNIFIRLALNTTTGFIGHIQYEASKRFECAFYLECQKKEFIEL